MRIPRPRLRRPRPSNGSAANPIVENPAGADDELHMSLLEHLDELRQRLTKAALGLAAGVVVGFPLASPMLAYLKEPYGDRFQALDPTNPVISYFRVALMIGAILSIPITTYQVMMFVLPGLTPKEKRILFRALPAITGLFIVGALFAWFILIPPALDFLVGFQSDIFVAQWTADGYLGFITALIFWMGVAFETPLIFFVLALMGLVQANTLVRNWRIAIVGSAVAAAFITPTIDPVNMFLVMGPLLTLYLFSIFLVGIGNRINRVEPS
ncbi:MAG: twin-arginine translocase subunit TatC [Anaerolineae bacterium]|nr:twin-arginine translocase subunit TatC [Anaerolineae bacterium]